MSEPSTSERKQTDGATPDREWESVVRRISDRIRSASGTAPTTTQSADLAQELAALERRALDAEGTLERERHAYTIRVQEMEEKLRKLEPWLRRLRAEFQEASTERDRLRDRVTQLEKDSAAAGGRPSEQEGVLRAELEAAAREAEAAKAARDAALAEAAGLRQRLDNDLRNLQESWRQRIEQAESARDKALDEVKSFRQQLGGQRRQDEEIKRLLKEVEQLETTTAAHKAVARAAQEDADGIRQKLSEAEKSSARALDESRGWFAKAEDAVRKLEAAEADLRRVRDENSEFALRLASAESAAKDLRAEAERARHEATEKDRALGGAHGEIETLRRTVEKLRAEVSDARQLSDRVQAETLAARREAEANAREIERLQGDAAAERRRAQDEAESLRREAAETRELAEESMRSEESLRRSLKDAEEKLAAENAQHAETGRRAQELEARLDGVQLEFADVRHGLEQARAIAVALESEKQNLLRTLDEEREGAAKRFEATEASWRSQMRAVEGRFEAELHKERQRAVAAEEAHAAAVQRHADELVARDDEFRRFRYGAAEYVRQQVQALVDGMDRMADGTMSDAEPVAVAVETEETVPASPGDVPAAEAAPAEPATGPVADADGPDWDRLLSDVQALRSEVEGLRVAEPREDTGSIAVEVTPAAPADDEQSVTSTVDPAEVGAIVRAQTPAEPQGDTDTRSGRRRRRR